MEAAKKKLDDAAAKARAAGKAVTNNMNTGEGGLNPAPLREALMKAMRELVAAEKEYKALKKGGKSRRRGQGRSSRKVRKTRRSR